MEGFTPANLPPRRQGKRVPPTIYYVPASAISPGYWGDAPALGGKCPELSTCTTPAFQAPHPHSRSWYRAPFMALEAAAAPLASAACNKAVAEGTAFHSLTLQLPVAGVPSASSWENKLLPFICCQEPPQLFLVLRFRLEIDLLLRKRQPTYS